MNRDAIDPAIPHKRAEDCPLQGCDRMGFQRLRSRFVDQISALVPAESQAESQAVHKLRSQRKAFVSILFHGQNLPTAALGQV